MSNLGSVDLDTIISSAVIAVGTFLGILVGFLQFNRTRKHQIAAGILFPLFERFHKSEEIRLAKDLLEGVSILVKEDDSVSKTRYGCKITPKKHLSQV